MDGQTVKTNAGFSIIMSETYNTFVLFDTVSERSIVLGEKNTTHGMEYVTWESDCKGGYFWGHYFNDKRAAIIDYHSRLLEHYDVSVRVFTGHWIYDSESDKTICSSCGHRIKGNFYNEETLDQYGFCPQCGAKMIDS